MILDNSTMPSLTNLDQINPHYHSVVAAGPRLSGSTAGGGGGPSPVELAVSTQYPELFSADNNNEPPAYSRKKVSHHVEGNPTTEVLLAPLPKQPTTN